MEALRAANRGMARAVCQGAKTAKRYAALGAGMEVDAQGYGREPTAMVRGVLSCLFVCLFLTEAEDRRDDRGGTLLVGESLDSSEAEGPGRETDDGRPTRQPTTSD